MVDKVKYSFPDEDGNIINSDDDDKSTGTKKSEDKKTAPEIEIVDDTPTEDRGRKPLDEEVDDPTDEELASYGDKVRDRIDKLTRARHDERRAREAKEREHAEAVRFAQAIAKENSSLKKRLEEGTTTYGTQSKELAEIKLRTAKAKVRAAHEAGDSEALADAQQEMASAVLAMDRAQSFKPTPLQSESEGANVQTDAPKRTPVAPVDEKVITWRERNPWFGKDKELTSFALGVHSRLVEEGYDTRSDSYYKAIDRRLREVFPASFKDSKQDSVSERKPPATVVAPSSRSSSATRLVLTKSQVEIANRIGVPLDVYARQVAKLEKESE